MKYTFKYVEEVEERAGTGTPEVEDYVVEIDGFGMPPMMEVVRVLTEIGQAKGVSIPMESKVMVMRYGIVGRQVKVSCKGRELGSFKMNSLNDNLEIFPVLTENPVVVMLLMRMTLANLIEKSMPLQPSGPAAAAGTTGSTP